MGDLLGGGAGVDPQSLGRNKQIFEEVGPRIVGPDNCKRCIQEMRPDFKRGGGVCGRCGWLGHVTCKNETWGKEGRRNEKERRQRKKRGTQGKKTHCVM